MSAATKPPPMTAEDFIAWSLEQPDGKRYELADGEIVAVASERSAYALTKAHIWLRLREAVAANRLQCQAYPDGMALRVDQHTVYEPDAMLRCGPPVPGDDVLIHDAIVVVEVVSPSSRNLDTMIKLMGYFRLATVRHYLIVHLGERAIAHHWRDDAGDIHTRLLPADAVIRLDPPGITLSDLFDDAPA